VLYVQSYAGQFSLHRQLYLFHTTTFFQGTVKNFAQNSLQSKVKKSQSSIESDSIVGSFQMLHIQIFLVTPLSYSHVTETGTNEHKRGVAIRKSTNDPSTPPDLPV